MFTRDRISEELRQSVLERDNYTCRYCGSTEGPFHLDHVYPFSKGGETTYQNLVTACRYCNISKRDKVGVWPVTVVSMRIDKKGNTIRGWLFIVLSSIPFSAAISSVIKDGWSEPTLSSLIGLSFALGAAFVLVGVVFLVSTIIFD